MGFPWVFLLERKFILLLYKSSQEKVDTEHLPMNPLLSGASTPENSRKLIFNLIKKFSFFVLTDFRKWQPEVVSSFREKYVTYYEFPPSFDTHTHAKWTTLSHTSKAHVVVIVLSCRMLPQLWMPHCLTFTILQNSIETYCNVVTHHMKCSSDRIVQSWHTLQVRQHDEKN